MRREAVVYNGATRRVLLQRQLLTEMPDASEIPAVLEAAAQAASEGNLASAEALLHEVVRLQSARLGPQHSDLASTYNNLAVVCEMAGKPEDAERFYRRSYAIASRSLQSDDPLVTTSLENLREFCEARGIPLTPTATLPPVEAERAPAAEPPAQQVAKPAASGPPPGPPTARPPGTVATGSASSTVSDNARSPRAAIIGVVAAVLAVTILSMAWSWRDAPTPETAVEPAAVDVTPAPVPAPPSEPAAAALPPALTASEKAAAPRPQREGAAIEVLEARLCQGLSIEGGQWRCIAPSNPVSPGQLSFYTRIAAREDVRIRHGGTGRPTRAGRGS